MTASLLLAAALACGGHALWYDLPAPDDMRGWEERSLPVGNGWFGVNVFGGVHAERLQVTEPTFLTRRNLTNALDIRLDFTYPPGVDGYRRGLDLETGVTWMEQADGPCKFRREAFASYPSRVLAWRITCSEKGKLNFSVSPEVPFLRPFGLGREAYVGRTGEVKAKDNVIDVVQHLQWHNVRFFGRLLVETDGRLETLHHTIDVKDATTATLYFSCATNYRLRPESFGAAAGEFSGEAHEPKMRDEDEPSEAVKARVAAAAKKGYEALKAEHLADFGGLMNRVSVDLGADAGDRAIPTDRLLAEYAKGRPSAWLEETYFQYGRYLLVSSSRPGTLPASLQGVWTAHDRSPWGSGYWHNVNVQMNYWPAFSCNLAECFEAYAAFNAAFRPVTRRFVKEYLERHKLGNVPADGEAPDIWCVGTAVYPYAVCGGPGVHSGPGTGGFTTKCFKDWWDFTRDEQALKTYIWPTLHGMADFLTRCVKEYDGACLSAFSASPEQQRTKKDANGDVWSYIHTVGCAFDQQMIQENNADMLELAKVLGVKDRVTELVERQMGRYEPVIVGESGQVKEFREEKRYGELGEYRHRHISQLVGLYPGSIINRNTPAWMAAARVSLTERGDESTGWALAHRLNCWARLGDGDHCHRLIRNLLSQRTNANLWDMHPPFQIDGNFGATAGVAEMLLQSHAGCIDLLPALPTAWAKAGSFRGLCARGAYEVDCTWKDGRPVSVRVRAKKGGVPEVRFRGAPVPFESAAEAGRIALPADPGEVATHAATEIRDYVKKATGETWTIVTNAPVSAGVAFAFVEEARLGEDGFRLSEKDGVLTIAASKRRGCLYGAYEYLERFVGVRWYSADTERVPKRAKVDVPKGFSFESKPDFLMRDAHWYDVNHDGDFAARMRVNANAPLEARHGGLPYRFGKGLWACHTFNKKLLPSDEFFTAHPEYFGLRNGKRSGENQPCLTNPDVIRIVTERVKDVIRRDPGARFYGVSQDDHQNYCECENCAKVDAEEGSHAGCVVRFVNAVAEAVEKEFPGAIIETLAYNYSRFPTKKTKFRHNVVPCVCSIECGFGPDPIEKGTTEFNRQFIACLEGWGKQTKEIYLWDYTTNFKDYYHFMPNLNVLQDNLRFFRKNGVKYMFEQGNTQGRHGFMAEMKTYLLSKWMWNADLDAETLVKDFTDGYYGAGGRYVRQFLAELEAYFADYCKKHPGFSALIYEEATAGVYDEKFLARAERLWQQAEDAARASGDAVALRNVRAGRMSTAFERFVKTPNAETAQALDALAKECGSRRWSEGGARTSEYELKLQKALPGVREWEIPGWDLVWQDEFNGTGVDWSNWHHERGFVRNRELQYYTKDRKENCRVENGCLVLEARKEKYVDPETDAKADYTSASLKSDWRYTFMYGRVDVRAKVPAGRGVWPAAWTLGADIKTQRWPWCGEIDIMEYVGHTPNRVWGTAHWSDKTVKSENGHKSSGGHLDLPAPLSDDFHVYSMTWDMEKITFSVDGRQYHEAKLADMQPNVRDWPPFNQYHYLILNLAYGGAWGGEKGVDDSCLPAKYLVDYVRVYKPVK